MNRKDFRPNDNTDKTISSKYSVHEGNLVRKFDTKEQAERFKKMPSSKWTKSNIELGIYKDTSKKKTWFEQQPQSYQDKVIAEEKYYDTADKRYDKNVKGKKILASSQADDLIKETPTKRYWVSRVTGEKSSETLRNGKWELD